MYSGFIRLEYSRLSILTLGNAGVILSIENSRLVLRFCGG